MFNRQIAAQNFIKRYGSDSFLRLIHLFGEGTSGEIIAKEFQVSRERIRQWRNIFGYNVSFYQVHPEVKHLMQLHNE